MPADARNRGLANLTKVTSQLLKGQVIAQYAAICVRQSSSGKDTLEILLITSRESGRWVIPKGWGMPKKRPHEVAAQEAWEEAGVHGRVKKKPAGYYTYVKKLKSGEIVPSLVQVHLLKVTNLSRDYPETGQRELRWFRPEEAAAAVDEPELKSLLRNTRCRLG